MDGGKKLNGLFWCIDKAILFCDAVYNMLIIYESVDWIPKCEISNERNRAVLS